MAKTPIDTGARFCSVCGESFYRKKYQSGRYEEPVRFEDRGTCGTEECLEEYRSRAQKKVWEKKKGPQQRVLTAADVWLSTAHNSLMSVRYKRGQD